MNIKKNSSKQLCFIILGLILFMIILFFTIYSISNIFDNSISQIEKNKGISQRSMKLLAVSVDENENITNKGSIAKLNLEIKKNNLNKERVFIETEPIIKLDTQISTKFAKDIACDYIINKKINLIVLNQIKNLKNKVNQTNDEVQNKLSNNLWQSTCDSSDFYYSFDSNAYYLSGPSASSIVAILTISTIEGATIRDDVAMTGTLQTGGYIGAVGGLKTKMNVAKKNGMKKILISSGTQNITSLIEYGNSIGIEVVAIENLDDAMKEFVIDEEYIEFYDSLDKLYNPIEEKQDSFYFKTMGNIAYEMMNETKKRFKLKYDIIKNYEMYYFVQKKAINEIEEEYKKKNFYSSASYSFIALTNIGTFKILSSDFPEIIKLIDKQLTSNSSRFIFPITINIEDNKSNENNNSTQYNQKIISKITDNSTKLNLMIKEYSNKYELEKEKYSYPNELSSVEFEIYGTILERLNNIKEDLDEINAIKREIKNNTNLNKEEIINRVILLSYITSRIEQRFYTVEQWSKFLNNTPPTISLNKNMLKLFCEIKSNEAIEYINFVDMFYGIGTKQRDEIIEYKNKEEYLECIFKSTLAKADMEYFLDEIYNSNDTLVVEHRIDSIKKEILFSNVFDEYLTKEFNFDISFPIVAYNYYEYSNVLKKTNPSLSLIYLEYAIELNKLHNEINRILIGTLNSKSKINNFPLKLNITKTQSLIKLSILISMFISLIIGIIIGYSIKKQEKTKFKKRTKTIKITIKK